VTQCVLASLSSLIPEALHFKCLNTSHLVINLSLNARYSFSHEAYLRGFAFDSPFKLLARQPWPSKTGDSSPGLPFHTFSPRLISCYLSCNFLRYHWIYYAGILRVFISPISHTANLINTDKVIQTGIHGINLPVSGDLLMYLLPYLFDKSELHPD
jgi:hypothetical protein